VFIANVSNVFLSPNVAGNVTGYTIAPTLPTGLSFNTNTGVITGVGTVASPLTSYTITASGAGGTSTSTTAGIQVTNNYFNNNYTPISFGGTGVVVLNGSTNDTISNTTTTTAGTATGDIVLYRNVAVLSGQAIDCIVKTVSVSSGTTFSAYDQAAVSGTSFSGNDPKFFSPQVSFPAGTSSGPGGSIQYSFQFILGGSYSSTTHAGLPVVMQNVKVNTYDIDGNGQANSNQINEFGGFSTSEIGSGSSLSAPTFNATTGLTTYRSSISTNVTNATDDATRVRLTYNNMSNFSIRVGGGGTAYFFLDFSAGPTFSTATPTSVPSVDLNTDVIGINNAGSGCGTSLSFTPASQTNVAATGKLTKMTVHFPTTDIVNGASEQLLINGATAGGTIALNASPAANTTFAVGGVTYTATGALTGTVRTLTFTPNGDTMTVANAETLLDALRYNNTNATPTAGSRNFTVNLFNAAFESPDAVFTASLDCVSIGGNIFHDNNGMVDSTVNATGASQFAAGTLYAVRVTPSNNHVIDVQPIAAGGAYNFGTVTPGTYSIYVSTTSPVLGSTFSTATLPATYVFTGENLGATAGNDHLTDGNLLVTVGSASITNANFGLQVPPTTADSTISNIANPGGFNNYVIPANAFKTNDADGSIDSIFINSFPTGANYLKIGNTYYTSGGTCPPQATACTAWPGSVVVPFSGGNPVPSISVDPTQEGTAAVVINFKAYDNARAVSNSSNLTLNFIGTSYSSISGKVWHDANGNGLVDGSDVYINTADASQTLYAVLIQQTHTYSDASTVLMTAPVSSSTGYSFSNVPDGNDYVIEIVSATSAPSNGSAASAMVNHLAAGWVGVSTNASGTIAPNLNTNNPVITLAGLASSKVNLNFGLEIAPEAVPATTTVPYPSVGTLYTLSGAGSNPPVPYATDSEDGTLGSGKTIVITSLPQYTTLRYNNTDVTLNQVITNLDPTLLKVLITANTVGQTQTSFKFTYKDAAGIADTTPALYTLNWTTPLPVTMASFSVAAVNNTVRLDWSTYSEAKCKGFGIERSADGRKWNEINFVNTLAPGGDSKVTLDYMAYDNSPVGGVNFYRLKQTDVNGNFVYTEVRNAVIGKESTVNIFPNPTTDLLNITVADWNNIAMVHIADANGKEVYQTKNASNGIKMGTMANGTYLLRIEYTNGDVKDFKIVKQ
jgi:hypothetical protein